MNQREAADYCGVSLYTLRNWRQAGKGPPYSAALGRDPRYHQADLDAFLWGGGVVNNPVEARRVREAREEKG